MAVLKDAKRDCSMVVWMVGKLGLLKVDLMEILMVVEWVHLGADWKAV